MARRYRYAYAGCFGPGGEILPSCTPAKAPSTLFKPPAQISSPTIQPGGQIKQSKPSTSKFDISAGQSHPTTTTTHAASPNNKPPPAGPIPYPNPQTDYERQKNADFLAAEASNRFGILTGLIMGILAVVENIIHGHQHDSSSGCPPGKCTTVSGQRCAGTISPSGGCEG